jgi:enoyl-CoA hydratase/carnithine racemase
MIETTDMVFERLPTATPGLEIGWAQLNRPAQLNALNLSMVEAMLTQCRAWASDTSIVAVLLTGNGSKGFCAGGDVAEVVRHVRSGRPDRFVYGDAFFAVEYQLDLLLHQYPKPLITWAHGVDMGGGVGLSVAGSERIVSPGLRMAMPEIHIGLFPDVGGGWFLNRVPGEAGLLLALTGAVIQEADALYAGLADHLLALDDRPAFLLALRELPWQAQADADRRALRGLCRHFAAAHPQPTRSGDLQRLAPQVRELAMAESVGALLQALERAARLEPWFEGPLRNLQQGSPTGACVTWEYMRRTRRSGIAEVLALDARMARQCQRHHDFPEGVRALLIDKTRDARWEYSALDAVPAAHIAGFFEPLP